MVISITQTNGCFSNERFYQYYKLYNLLPYISGTSKCISVNMLYEVNKRTSYNTFGQNNGIKSRKSKNKPITNST